MHIKKEKLEVEDSLNNKVNMILKFLNIKAKLVNGSIISIKNTNLAYIEPYNLKIDGITYLFFNECNNVYINDLTNSISINELQNYIKEKKKALDI